MPGWREIADRAVRGLGVRAGEVVQIREHSGRFEVVLEMALAVERAGATPLPELTPPSYVDRLLHEAGADHLAAWDRHRIEWLRRVDRVLVLQGADLDLATAPGPARDAWTSAVHRLVELEDERRLPFLLVAVPTPERAEVLSLPFDALESRLLPALAATVEELQRPIERTLARLREGSTLTLRGADGCELRMSTTGRHWLADDGLIDAEDRRRGGHVSNLPAGSVYSTVVENSVVGQLRLPPASGTGDVRLTFEGGRIVAVAGDGRDRFESLLMQHSGDRDRISHIGIGLNPYLREAVGWPLVGQLVCLLP
ncbi:MAG: aminopeptidase [Dehalococcoidia bacterium]